MAVETSPSLPPTASPAPHPAPKPHRHRNRVGALPPADLPHASIAELAARGDLPATTEGLAIDLAMRVGDLLAGSGLSVNDTVATMHRVCEAYGLTRAQIDITTYALTVSYNPGGGLPPVTVMRTVSTDDANLSQVAATNRLVRLISEGLPLETATARFDAIRHARPPYPPWVAWVAAGSTSLVVQLLFTTSWSVLAIALVTGLLLNRLMEGLCHLGVPPFFRQLAGGWFTVAVAVLISWINRTGHPGFLVGVSPTLVAAGCVFQLVVGMKFVSAMQDAIDAFYVTATARLLQVAMETSGIVVGLITGLDLANRAGAYAHIEPTMYPLGPVPAQYVAAAGAAMVWAIGRFADGRTILLSGAAALVAWLGFSVSTHAGVGRVMTDFVAAVAAAFLFTMLVRRTNLPGFAIVNASIVVLVPGLRLYYGLLWLVGTPTVPADTSVGWSYVGLAAAIALAIAAGASLGMYFGRPVGDRVMPLPLSLYGRLRSRRSAD